MAEFTQNYNLKKPAEEDFYNINDQNDNMDIIDAELKRIENEINNIDVTGTQITVDQSQAPASPGNGTLAQLFSWLANRIKAITGKSNWWDAPAKTLEDLDTHIAQTSAHGATSAATANTIIMRDANGRAKVAAPSESDDIARKAEVDNVQANLTTHANLTTAAHGGIVAASDVVTTAQANKILRLNASAKLPASITGDADTVDGVHVTSSSSTGLRKITTSTSNPSGGSDGDIWIVYTP